MPTDPIRPGAPHPLGVTYDGQGVNVTIFSEVAERVELCPFDSDGRETRLCLPEATGRRWHGYVPGVGPGQRYGFRVHDPGSRTKDCAAIPPSCFWILTLEPLRAV
jgi:glycogen operon protein